MSIFFVQKHQIISNFILTNINTWSEYCKNNKLDSEYVFRHECIISLFFVIIKFSHAQEKNNIKLSKYIGKIFNVECFKNFWNNEERLKNDFMLIKNTIKHFVNHKDFKNINPDIENWGKDIVKYLNENTDHGRGRIYQFFISSYIGNDLYNGIPNKQSLEILKELFYFMKEKPHSTI